MPHDVRAVRVTTVSLLSVIAMTASVALAYAITPGPQRAVDASSPRDLQPPAISPERAYDEEVLADGPVSFYRFAEQSSSYAARNEGLGGEGT